MTKSGIPYSRLVDNDVVRSSPDNRPKRPLNAAFFIVGIAVIVAAITGIVLLAVLMYILSQSPVGSTQNLKTTEPGTSTGSKQLDLLRLLHKVRSLEQDIVSLRSQCQRCGSFLQGSETSQRDRSTLAPPSDGNVDEDKPAARNVNFIEDSSTNLPKSLSTDTSGITPVIPEPSVPISRHRQPRSKNTRKTSRRNQTDPHRQPDRNSSDRDRSDRDRSDRDRSDRDRSDRDRSAPDQSAPDQSNRDGQQSASRGTNEEMIKERNGRNSPRREPSHSTRRGSACRRCIDSPPPFGRAIHIQGRRNGNIHITGDGSIQGYRLWEKSEWTRDTDQYFDLNLFGTVTVTESGLYYVYSQILFYDPNDTVGQSININGVAYFTCTKSNISAEAKQSTCYVGGIVRINSGDNVGIKLSIPNVTIALYTDTSYFGLFRVA